MNLPATQKMDLIMILIDGSYLYEIGKAIELLRGVTDDDTYWAAYLKLYKAREQLDGLLNNSVYKPALRLLLEPGQELLAQINALYELALTDNTKAKTVTSLQMFDLKNALFEFDTIFKAEFRNGNMFLVTPKGAYDSQKLISYGELLFPTELKQEVPEAIADVRAGARCLAFELYTASGFHLHRANESVLLKYFDVISAGKERPKNRNMGTYIKALIDHSAPEIITSCLRDLKNMHRNPLMHPDQSIESVDEAIALLNSIHTAMVAMLKGIESNAD